MKKLFIALCCCGLLLTGCKEKAPNINLTNAIVIDTTYTITPVPATDPHNILVEDFTGQGCSNCPAAHETLRKLDSVNSGRLNIVGLYIQNFSQTTPPTGAKYDFRDSTASDIGTTVYGGIGSMPIAGIDRIPVSGSTLIYQGNWSSTITNQMAIQDSLNLKVTSGYDTTTGYDTITATITYTQPVSSSHNLSIVIVEDSMVDIQEYPAFDPVYPSGFDNNYVFTNVFRAMVSSAPFGDPVLASMVSKEAGRVYRHTYIYKLKPGVIPSHCRVIAFVSNTSDKHIIQSCQTKLKP